MTLALVCSLQHILDPGEIQIQECQKIVNNQIIIKLLNIWYEFPQISHVNTDIEKSQA